MTLPLIHPVLLCGGAGTRLWPLSRSLYPKQLLALTSQHSLLQETALRVRGDRFAPPIVVCNEDHRFLVMQQLGEIGVTPAAILLEPKPRNTAPAIAAAALSALDDSGDAILLVLPTDHLIADAAGFRAAVLQAVPAAERALVTFGVVPSRPETGFGYIRRGAAYPGVDGCFTVAAFVEKPPRETAQRYVASGEYFWNGGVFLLSARRVLDELAAFEPGLVEACSQAYAKRTRDLSFLRLEAASFAEAKAISIDRAVMERTKHAAVVPIDVGWSDLGSWLALMELGPRDATTGNVVAGPVLTHDVRDSYLRTDGPLLAAIGLTGIVVVATDDAVLIGHKDSVQDVSKLVELVAKAGRFEHVNHTTVHRPWGTYKVLESGANFQVKLVTVSPGAKLSLQLHHRRAEHWVVIAGRATVTRGDEVMVLAPNESTYIPIGTKHRLENTEAGPLALIEVQTGDYLGEDDIVRFDDHYGRKN